MRTKKSDSDNYQFGFGSIKKVFSPEDLHELRKTSIGDIIMISGFKCIVILDYKPEPPLNVQADPTYRNTLRVTWKLSEKEILPITRLHVRWRPTEKNSNYPVELWNEEEIEPNEKYFDIRRYFGAYLIHGTNIEIHLACESIFGKSLYSSGFAKIDYGVEDDKASSIIDFFQNSIMQPPAQQSIHWFDWTNWWKVLGKSKVPQNFGVLQITHYTWVSKLQSMAVGHSYLL